MLWCTQIQGMLQNIASAKEESAEAVQGHQGKEQSEPKVQHGERALLAN
jgi:hypothetical protein